jgi:hypothetical protein
MRRNATVGREKTLGVAGRFEAAHPPLPLAGGLMGVLRAVVEIAMLPVFYPR